MKRSPGCNCCSDACEDNCIFPCTGSTLEFGCVFCGIDIQIATPDSVSKIPILGEPDCPASAPCWACYIVLDRYFLLSDGTLSVLPCGTFNWQNYSDGLLPDMYIPRPLGQIRGWPCWNQSSYDCPYDHAAETEGCPGSKIVIADHITPFTPRIEMSGAEWDGTCGKITLVVSYSVFEFDTSYNEVPIDGGDGCVDPKYTAYQHTFELNYCTCEDLTNAFAYVSTTAIDSCAGAVADPCNLETATIRLYKRYDDEQCSICQCLNCEGYITQQVLVTISGPSVNGTFVLNKTSGIGLEPREQTCYYESSSSVQSCGEFFIQLSITCLECDKFESSITITERPSLTWIYSGRTDAFSCGESPAYNTTHSMGACNFGSHTIQLSFVPA